MVLPQWQERCKELESYAEQIWMHGHLPVISPEFPEIEWEGNLDPRAECTPIFRLDGVEENDGALIKGKKRLRKIGEESLLANPKRTC